MGSSASTIAGRPTSARAIATRWRSPPESLLGRKSARGASPTRASVSAARSRRSETATPRTAVLRRRSPGRWSAPTERTAGRRTRYAWHARWRARDQRARRVEARYRNDPRARALERAHDVQQRRLPRTRGAHDRHELALVTPRSSLPAAHTPAARRRRPCSPRRARVTGCSLMSLAPPRAGRRTHPGRSPERDRRRRRTGRG